MRMLAPEGGRAVRLLATGRRGRPGRLSRAVAAAGAVRRRGDGVRRGGPVPGPRGGGRRARRSPRRHLAARPARVGRRRGRDARLGRRATRPPRSAAPRVRSRRSSDVLWLAFYPAAYLAVMLLVRSRLADGRRALWLDGLLAALAVAAVAVAVAWEPVSTAGGARGHARDRPRLPRRRPAAARRRRRRARADALAARPPARLGRRRPGAERARRRLLPLRGGRGPGADHDRARHAVAARRAADRPRRLAARRRRATPARGPLRQPRDARRRRRAGARGARLRPRRSRSARARPRSPSPRSCWCSCA